MIIIFMVPMWGIGKAAPWHSVFGISYGIAVILVSAARGMRVSDFGGYGAVIRLVQGKLE